MNHILKNEKIFFGCCGAIFLVCVIVANFISAEFVTSFAQNIVKTTGAVYAFIFVFYSFIMLYRFLKKEQGTLLLTLKEWMLNITFLACVYNFALILDQILIYANKDVDAVPSNIFTFILIFLFFVFQWYLLGKRRGLRMEEKAPIAK